MSKTTTKHAWTMQTALKDGMGHGTFVGSCGHILQRCRCTQAHKRYVVDSLCAECLLKNVKDDEGHEHGNDGKFTSGGGGGGSTTTESKPTKEGDSARTTPHGKLSRSEARQHIAGKTWDEKADLSKQLDAAKEAHLEDIRDAFEGDHIEHGVKFRPNDMAEMLEKRGVDGLKADVSGGIDKFKQAYAEKIQSLRNEFNLSDQQVNRLNKALDRDVAKISERADEMLVAGHALEQAEKQLENIDDVVASKLPPEPDGDDPAHDAWEEQVDQLHEQIEEELNEQISNARDVFEHKASRLDDLMDDTPRVQDAIATMGDNLAGTLDDNYPIPVYDRDDLNGEDSDEAKKENKQTVREWDNDLANAYLLFGHKLSDNSSKSKSLTRIKLRDETGHEHGSDGRFTSTGGGGSGGSGGRSDPPAKPTHSEIAAVVHAADAADQTPEKKTRIGKIFSSAVESVHAAIVNLSVSVSPYMEDILDTVNDAALIKYAKNADVVSQTTGLSAGTVATIVSHVLARVVTRLQGKKELEGITMDELVDATLAILKAIHEAAGLDDDTLPDRSEVAKMLQDKIDAKKQDSKSIVTGIVTTKNVRDDSGHEHANDGKFTSGGGGGGSSSGGDSHESSKPDAKTDSGNGGDKKEKKGPKEYESREHHTQAIADASSEYGYTSPPHLEESIDNARDKGADAVKESVAKVLQHHAEHYEGLLNNLRDVGANEKEIGSIEKAIERARNQAEKASGALEKASAKVDAAAEKLKAADYTPEEYPEEPKEPDEIPEPDEPTEPDEIEYPDEPAEPDYQDIPDEPEPPSKDDFEDEADYDAAVKQHEQEHSTWKADVEKVREANAKADEDYAKAVADHKDKCKEVDSQNEANAKAYKDAMKEYPKAVEKVRSQNDKQSAAYTKAKEKWDKECEKVDARNEKADAKLNAAEQAHDEAKDAYDEAKDNFFDAVNNSESIDAQVDKVSDAIYNRVGDEWDEKEEAAAKESKEKGLDVVAINTKHATSKLVARENSWREKRFSAAYLLDPDKGFYGKDLLRNKLGKQLDAPSIDQSAMTVSSIITTEDVDRSGDIVVASGLDVAEHMRNPVVLLNHGFGYQLPIGKAQDSAGAYTVIPGDGFWRGTTYFSQSSKEAIQIFELIVEGILKGVSIGFIPDPDHVDYRTEKGISGGLGAIGGPLGLIIRKARLLEYSHVTIPDNPQALTDKIGKGLIAGEQISPLLMKSFSAYVPQLGLIVPSGFSLETTMATPTTATQSASTKSADTTTKHPDTLPLQVVKVQGKRHVFIPYGYRLEKGVLTKFKKDAEMNETSASEGGQLVEMKDSSDDATKPTDDDISGGGKTALKPADNDVQTMEDLNKGSDGKPMAGVDNDADMLPGAQAVRGMMDRLMEMASFLEEMSPKQENNAVKELIGLHAEDLAGKVSDLEKFFKETYPQYAGETNDIDSSGNPSASDATSTDDIDAGGGAQTKANDDTDDDGDTNVDTDMDGKNYGAKWFRQLKKSIKRSKSRLDQIRKRINASLPVRKGLSKAASAICAKAAMYCGEIADHEGELKASQKSAASYHQSELTKLCKAVQGGGSTDDIDGGSDGELVKSLKAQIAAKDKTIADFVKAQKELNKQLASLTRK